MKTAYYGLMWLLVAVLAFSTAALIDALPVSNDGYAAKVYESWSGVVNIWLCNGWKAGNGSFKPWLNGVCASFERKHSGVRVQITSVDDAQIKEFASAENPPDVILFSPTDIPCGNLAPLEPAGTLRDGLISVGQYNSTVYALPVAMGGYAWAVNTSLLDGVPLDWSKLDDLKPIKSKKRYIMDVPADSSHYCWSGALVALMSPRRVYIEGTASETGDIDIGLPVGSPSPTPEPAFEIVVCRLPQTLSAEFRTRASVYGAFTSGQVAAIPVTQYEIRNLTRLSQSGKGVSWSVESGGGAFSDQLLMAASVDMERPDREARLELAKEFIAFMLTDESQKKLASVRAFSVTDVGEMYSGQYAMAQLESIVTGNISLPNAFDGSFRESMKREADRLMNPE